MVRMISNDVSNLFAAELVRQFPQFKFSGLRTDFLSWQEKWEDFVQLARHASGESLTTYMMLALLRDRLDDVTAREVSVLMRDPTRTYEGVYADLCRRFGSESTAFRRRWRRVHLQQDRKGNISPAEWRRFRTEILAILDSDPGEDETAVREHILVQLPESWRAAVVKHELKLRAQTKLARVVLPEGEDVHALWSELVAEVPTASLVSCDSKNLLIACGDRTAQKKLLELNGLYLEGKKLRVTPVEAQCTVRELCEVVDQRVEQWEELQALVHEEAEERIVRVVAQQREVAPQVSSTPLARESQNQNSKPAFGECKVCKEYGRNADHEWKQCEFSKKMRSEGKFCSWCAQRGHPPRHAYARCPKWTA